MKVTPFLQEVFDFARLAHAEVPGQGVEYFDGHVMDVVKEVYKYTQDENTLATAALHDVAEDNVLKNENVIADAFGFEIGVLAWRMKDEPGKNRKQKKARTYWKQREDERTILVKLCDRLVNMRRSLGTKFGDMYGKEYYTFYAAFWRPNQWPEIWEELDQLYEKHQELRSNWTK